MMRWAFLLLSAVPVTAVADDVILRGGGELSGEIVEYTSASITIDVGPGRVTLPASRVDHVVRGASPLAVYRERAARLGATDVSGWLALAAWARAHDLETQSREAFEHVVSVDPRNDTAQRGLGNVLYDGRWMTPEESYRAQGLVRFEGEWISPDEREDRVAARDAAARAGAARADAEARAADARARAAEAEARAAEAESATEGVPMGFTYGGLGYGLGFGVPFTVIRTHRQPHRGMRRFGIVHRAPRAHAHGTDHHRP